jgi:hypothetical protein
VPRRTTITVAMHFLCGTRNFGCSGLPKVTEVGQVDFIRHRLAISAAPEAENIVLAPLRIVCEFRIISRALEPCRAPGARRAAQMPGQPKRGVGLLVHAPYTRLAAHSSCAIPKGRSHVRTKWEYRWGRQIPKRTLR